jgi:hypothetical protein
MQRGALTAGPEPIWPKATPRRVLHGTGQPLQQVDYHLRELEKASLRGASWPATAGAHHRTRQRKVRLVRFSVGAARPAAANASRLPPVAPFAKPERERITPLHACVRIATFRCAAPAPCGRLADERRIVAGDECGLVRTRDARPAPTGGAAPPTRSLR